MSANKLSLSPTVIAWKLAAVVALFATMNMAMQLYRLYAKLDQVPGLAMVSLDGEQNLPALFSTLLLIAAALLLALIAFLEPGGKRSDRLRWAILAAGFAAMAMDETLALHEKLVEPVRALLGTGELGVFFFAWVIPGLILSAAVGVFFLPFLLRLPRRTAVAFVIAGALFLGGALGVELVEGWWREGHGHRNVTYHLLVTLEECMEMAGIIVFIRALLIHIAARFGELRVAIGDSPAVPSDAADAIDASPSRAPSPVPH